MPPLSKLPWPLRTNRRSLLLAACLGFLYPLVRFINFSLPKQPVRFEVFNAPPKNGVLTLAEFILFDDQGKTWALSRKCTHLGCTLSYHEASRTLECPCHQSQFSITGQVLKGPAQKALTLFTVEKRPSPPFYVITS